MSATFQWVSGPRGMSLSEHRPVVGIIMGSTSDWETMRHADETLSALQVPHEVKVVSAHRTPQRLYDYAGSAVQRGLKIIIAGAGGAAHLPGIAASMRSEEHTSELQSLMRISYAVFCLKKKIKQQRRN